MSQLNRTSTSAIAIYSAAAGLPVTRNAAGSAPAKTPESACRRIVSEGAQEFPRRSHKWILLHVGRASSRPSALDGGPGDHFGCQTRRVKVCGGPWRSARAQRRCQEARVRSRTPTRRIQTRGDACRGWVRGNPRMPGDSCTRFWARRTIGSAGMPTLSTA
jgi:hypothetical protein